MKKIYLTVSYEEEKDKTLRCSLEQKHTKSDDDLVHAVATLLNRNDHASDGQ